MATRLLNIVVVALLLLPSAARGSELLAGVAAADITPPIPWRMSGYFTERLSTAVKDPLHAKALVLQQGKVSAALVFCDLIGIPKDLSQRIRTEASAATGIPAANIAINATHTHTGPLYYEALRDHFHQRAVKRFGKDPNESINYHDKLAKEITAAIVEAKDSLKPAQLAATIAREERLSFNRRFHLRNGTVQFNPGQQNPDVIRPAGPIDPDVGVVTLCAADAKQPFAALIEFALHLDTTSGTEYSADYPHFMEEQLRATLGEDFTALFGAGTCGDINHIDVRIKGVRTAAEIGRMLAETAAAAMEPSRITPISEPALAVGSATVEVPLQEFSEAEVAKARQDIERVGQRQLAFLEEVKVCSILEVARLNSDSAGLEVQAFRLSKDVAIVTLPAEVFVELGLAIKAASPFKTTIVIELTNDDLGYIPTKKAFAEGSYETVNSRVQPGGGEAMVETAVKLLKELKSRPR